MSAHAPRQALGTFFRSILEWLDGQKLREQVRAQVSPETQALFEKPPGTLSWMPSKAIDEVETAIGALAGKAALHELGLVTGRGLGGTMIQPVIRAAFFLLGQTPDSVFGNLDRFFTLATRGISFRYQPTQKGQGIVEARFAGPDTPPAAFEVLRGSLGFVFEVSGQPGTVDAPEVVSNDGQGALVRYKVSWG